MKAFAVAVMALVLAGCVAASGAGEQCAAAGGVCRDPNGGCGNGDWKTGLCPGTTRCCIAWTTTAQCKAKNGVCAAKAGCAGTQVTGLCPGTSVCCVAKTSAPTTPTPAPVTPAPAPVTPTPTPTPAPGLPPGLPPVGTVVKMPSGAGQIGFCTADGKRAGLCKSAAACGKLAGHTAKSGICTHSQVCCTPPPGVALDGQLGLDIEGSVISAATAQCYRQTGFAFFMVRVWRTSNTVDTSAPDNIRRLIAAGFSDVDVYAFHDFRRDPVAAANTFMKYLKDQGVLGLVKRVWLDIERDINGAYMWSTTDKASNARKLNAMIEAVKAWGKLPGIYAPGAGGWDEIMGSAKVADVVPMWYVSRRGYNNDASDEDWVPFANWNANPPVNTQHQFYSGDGSAFKVCGVSGLDWTYRRAPITLPYGWDPATKKAV